MGDLSQANFQQSESNDGTGAVTGSYSVNLPDGRIQTVTYNANDITGNVATVEYSGEAVYPPAPAGGYVAAAPVAIAHPLSTMPPLLPTLSTPPPLSTLPLSLPTPPTEPSLDKSRRNLRLLKYLNPYLFGPLQLK